LRCRGHFIALFLPAVPMKRRQAMKSLDAMEGGEVHQIDPDRLDGLLIKQFQ
jgi:hypothetical protein